MQTAKDIAYDILIGCKASRVDPKWLEYRYLLKMKLIDPIKTPFYKWESMVSVGSILRARRKLIEDGEIVLDKFTAMVLRQKEEKIRKFGFRGEQ
jgi:hypothetical protein|tara:strand:- start:3649 stop:3933 length:285 start_codon:yes stop_codon:yes gene_type:complete